MPGRAVPEYRGGLRPGVVVLCLLDANPSFSGSLVHCYVSPVSRAQWASAQLKGSVQWIISFVSLDILLTGPHWPKGSRRKKRASEPSTVSEGFQRRFGRVAKRFQREGPRWFQTGFRGGNLRWFQKGFLRGLNPRWFQREDDGDGDDDMMMMR